MCKITKKQTHGKRKNRDVHEGPLHKAFASHILANLDLASSDYKVCDWDEWAGWKVWGNEKSDWAMQERPHKWKGEVVSDVEVVGWYVWEHEVIEGKWRREG